MRDEKLDLFDSVGNERGYYVATDVFREIEKFIDENFRGLVEITVDLPDDAVIFVSLESLTLFFRDIIEMVFGRALLKINVYSQEQRMIVHFSTDPPMKCEYSVNSRFVNMARIIGLDVERANGKTQFSLGCFEEREYKVYAPFVKDVGQVVAEILKKVFSEILSKNAKK